MSKRSSINAQFANALDTRVSELAILNGVTPDAFKASILSDAKLDSFGLDAAERTIAVYVGWDLPIYFAKMVADSEANALRATFTKAASVGIDALRAIMEEMQSQLAAMEAAASAPVAPVKAAAKK